MIIFNDLFNITESLDKSAESWVSNTIQEENLKEGNINYIFCDDAYLLDKNIKFSGILTFVNILFYGLLNCLLNWLLNSSLYC